MLDPRRARAVEVKQWAKSMSSFVVLQISEHGVIKHTFDVPVVMWEYAANVGVCLQIPRIR